MSITFYETEEGGKLVMGGQCSIDEAVEIRDALMRAFQHADRIALTIEKDTVADLSFLQLLCAAHRTALRENRIFELDCSAAAGMQRVMQEAGCIYKRSGFCTSVDMPSVAGGGGNG